MQQIDPRSNYYKSLIVQTGGDREVSPDPARGHPVRGGENRYPGAGPLSFRRSIEPALKPVFVHPESRLPENGSASIAGPSSSMGATRNCFSRLTPRADKRFDTAPKNPLHPRSVTWPLSCSFLIVSRSAIARSNSRRSAASRISASSSIMRFGISCFGTCLTSVISTSFSRIGF